MHERLTCRGGCGCCCAGHHVGSDRYNTKLQQFCTFCSGCISGWSDQAPQQLADLARAHGITDSYLPNDACKASL